MKTKRQFGFAWCFLGLALVGGFATFLPPVLMPYVSQSDLAGKIPAAFIVQALDDDGNGVADAGVWDLIASQVGTAIDGALGQRYAVPFADPLPPIVAQAALIYAAEALYTRRGVMPNPWSGQADAMRSKLNAIAKGEEPLSPSKERQKPSGTLISEQSRTTFTDRG